MRFDKKITLVKNGEDVYNESTGNYDTTEPVKTDYWANVNDMSEDSQTFIFGGLTEGAYTIRIQGGVVDFDYLEMGNKDYNVNQQRKLRRYTTLKVSGRQ